MKPSRVTNGIDSTGRKFVTNDEWNMIGDVPSTSTPWTGKTVFLVDKNHDSRWGTDQRRQRDEIINNNYQTNNLNEDRPRLQWADLVDSDEEWIPRRIRMLTYYHTQITIPSDKQDFHARRQPKR